MRIAYADPPYIGQAKRRYGGAEVDFAALIADLEHYDGWALSCNSNDLHTVLPLCPRKTRISAWVKTWARPLKNVYPTYSWEPVLFRPARRLPCNSQARDSLVSLPGRNPTRGGVIVQDATGKMFTGWKPEQFCFWLFSDLLAAQRGDTLADLFPGTGAVTRAWEQWQRQMRLPIQFEEVPA